jgi:hypothetical protein
MEFHSYPRRFVESRMMLENSINLLFSWDSDELFDGLISTRFDCNKTLLSG